MVDLKLISERAHPAFTRTYKVDPYIPEDLGYRPGWDDWSNGYLTNLWFHSTDTDEPFALFCRTEEGSIGFHAGTLSAAHDRHETVHAHEPISKRHYCGYILGLIIRYSKAFRIDDPHTWDLETLTAEFLDQGLINEAEEEFILYKRDEAAIFAVLERSGFDAILYPNMCEGVRGEESIIVWRTENIRSASAVSFIEGCPLLCPTLRPEEFEIDIWKSQARRIDDFLFSSYQNAHSQWEIEEMSGIAA